MKIRRTVRHLLLPALLAAAGAAAFPALAAGSFKVVVAPPAQQVEVVPALAPGYVWAPGYWAWHGDHHVWIHGRSIYQRAGYRWAPDRWEQRNNVYYRHPGGWEPDRDNDGPGRHRGRGPKHP